MKRFHLLVGHVITGRVMAVFEFSSRVALHKVESGGLAEFDDVTDLDSNVNLGFESLLVHERSVRTAAIVHVEASGLAVFELGLVLNNRMVARDGWMFKNNVAVG